MTVRVPDIKNESALRAWIRDVSAVINSFELEHSITTGQHTAVNAASIALTGKITGKAQVFAVTPNGTNQTVTTGVETLVVWNVVQIDTDNIFDLTGSRCTPTVAGAYRLDAQVTLTATAINQNLTVEIWKNNAIYRHNHTISRVSTDALGVAVSAVVEANGTTDYFEVYFLQDSGIDKTIDGDGEHTFFQGHLIALS